MKQQAMFGGRMLAVRRRQRRTSKKSGIVRDAKWAAWAAWIAVLVNIGVIGATIAVPEIERYHKKADENREQLVQIKAQIGRAIADIQVTQAMLRVLDPQNGNGGKSPIWGQYMKQKLVLARRQEELAFNRLPANGAVSDLYLARDALRESMLDLVQVRLKPSSRQVSEEWELVAGAARLSMSLLAQTVNHVEARHQLPITYDPRKAPMVSAELELSRQTMEAQKALGFDGDGVP